MRKLKVGFLMPYSGIYPYYGHHLMAGMQMGMQPALARQRSISTTEAEFVPIFTKRGDPSTLKSALEQLLFFERVDLLSGLISYKTMPELLPLINKHQNPALFFDLGEYVPSSDVISPYVFYTSQQIWQSEFALGRWAQQKFLSPGMVVMPLYEAGYQLHSCFWEGVQSGGGQSIGIHTIPKEKSSGSVVELDDFFEVVSKSKPAFVHGIFTGDQGLDFIRQWVQSEFYTKIPLILVENMAYEDLLMDIKELDLTFYTASSWSRESENRESQQFVQQFESASGQKANIFALLGYEAGLLIREVQSDILRGDTAKAIQLLTSESIKGPRGFRNFDPQSFQPISGMDILQIKTVNKRILKLVVGQPTGHLMSVERMKQMNQECVSGWQNPFLCV